MKIKNIFFDFDGVIAESVSAKTQAFRELYLPYGEAIADKVVNHHINHGGVSRYEKFKIYHKEFLKQEINEEEVKTLASKFSELVLDKVINSKEVTGAKLFLEKYYKTLNFWIITGTPTPEIKIITAARGLEHFFINQYGSPKNKKHWTEYIINKHDLKREETLFLGDATTDFEAAEYSKLHFALREHEENTPIFTNYKGFRFKNFNELEVQIKNYL